MKSKHLLFLTAAIMLLSCATAVASPRDWTVMVFMNGDNNLEGAAIADINEMESAGSNANVAVVVQVDRIAGYDNSNGDWETTRRYYITKDNDSENITSTFVSDLGEQNMGDPAVLHDFVNWAMFSYPASHYLLVIWDHGSGWHKILPQRYPKFSSSANYAKGEFSNGSPLVRNSSLQRVPPAPHSPFATDWGKIAGVDETDNDRLYNSEIKEALQTLPKLDIIGFDACLMGMLETAFEIRNLSLYMIASEESIPEYGWDYNTFLNELIVQPTYSGAQVCSLAVISYAMFYEAFDDNTQTLSAVDLQKIPNITSALNNFVDSLVYSSEWSIIHNCANSSESFDNQPFYDLYHFAELVSVNILTPAAANMAESLKAALESSIILNYTEAGHPNANGLSIYFPPSQSHSDVVEYFEGNIEFPDSTNWPQFLCNYWGNGVPIYDFPEPNNTMTQAGAPLDPAFIYYSYISSLSDVDWYLINSGIPDSIIMTLQVPNNADYDLRLYDSTGLNLLTSSNNRGNGIDEVLTYYCPSAQYYYLKVESYLSLSLMPYYLSVEQKGNQRGRFLLSYDDDEPDGAVFCTTAGETLGKVFSLPSYPMYLDRIWINFPTLDALGGGGNGSFYLIIADNYGNVTDPPIGPLMPADTGWGYLDLSSSAYSLYTDFFIGVIYDGTNTPGIGADSNMTGTDLYYDPLSDEWSFINQLFLRVDVRYPEPLDSREQPTALLPKYLMLAQNYPNPFNPSTVISYELPRHGLVSLDILNILGERVRTLMNSHKEAGRHSITWDGKNDAGKPLSSGIYFYRLKVDGAAVSRKMQLLK